MSRLHHPTKAQTYARQLDAARSAGLWAQQPQLLSKRSNKAADGQPASSLSELIRKFLKHNPDRAFTALIASTELTLRQLLVATYQNSGFDHDKVHLADDPESGQSALPPLVMDQDHELVRQSLEKLKSSLDKAASHDAGSQSPSEQNSARIVLAFGHYIIGDYTQSLRYIREGSFQFPDIVPVNVEKYEVVLMMIGMTICAAAHERSGAPASTTLEAYSAACELYDRCLSFLAISTAEEGYEELHSWAELAIYRICILSRTAIPPMPALEAHRRYHSRSKYWPSSFRLYKRCVFYKSYVKLLFETARADSWRPSPSWPTTTDSQVTRSSFDMGFTNTGSLQSAAGWRAELLAAERSYDAVLKRITSFPKSGSINALVLEFCDLIVEGWRIGGSDSHGAVYVIAMLHEATQKTFHSQRILRHLIHLLGARREWNEAEAALDLYFQLFTTVSPAGTSLAADQPDGVENVLVERVAEPSSEHTGKGRQITVDNDSDQEFIETIVYGGRMLIKFVDNPEKATNLFERAASVMQATTNLAVKENIVLRARLFRMRGIAAGALAQKADHETRPALHKAYLDFLTQSAELNPSSFETLYHLAFAQAELRDIDSALVTARKAVELRPTHKIAWHLLGLLTSASKELKLALDIVDVGLSNVEEEETDGLNGTQTPRARSSNPAISQVSATDSLRSPDSALRSSSDLGQQRDRGGRLQVPTAPDQLARHASAMQNMGDGSQPKLEFLYEMADDLEATVQLRMTKNVLLEALEGAEVALADQQGLFGYFAQISPQLRTQEGSKPDPYRTKAREANMPKKHQAASLPPSLSRSILRRSRLKGRKGGGDPRATGMCESANLRALCGADGVWCFGVGAVRSWSQASQLSRASQVHMPSEPTHQTEGTMIAASETGVGVGEEEMESEQGRGRAGQLLQALWLMSAATFRRWGKTDECRGAIQEAEALDRDSAEVWVQYALHCLATRELPRAIEALRKAIALADGHIAAVVHLARIMREEGAIELAEGMLQRVTQTIGWDVPEAWLLLGQIFVGTERAKRGRECFGEAVRLEESKPVRVLSGCVPRCL